jgi:hypothetical protein
MTTWAWVADPPVSPDAQTARQWAVHELAKPEYHRGDSLLTRLLRWITEQVNSVREINSGLSLTSTLIMVGIIVAVVAAAFVVAGPVRRTRALRDHRAVLDDDDTRTARQIRDAAQAAADSGQWALATAEWFRAAVRGMEERTIIDTRPGRTADEAAVAGARHLREVADGLVHAARLFDAVVYGSHPATADDAAQMRATEQAVRATRPSDAGEPAGTAR